MSGLHILDKGKLLDKSNNASLCCLFLCPKLYLESKLSVKLSRITYPDLGKLLDKSATPLRFVVFLCCKFTLKVKFSLELGRITYPDLGLLLDKSNNASLCCVFLCLKLYLESKTFGTILGIKKAEQFVRLLSVGVAGFEPAASCSQSRRDNRATLHPESECKYKTKN